MSDNEKSSTASPRQPTMYAFVFDTLRDEILTGRLAPGARLNIEEIEKRLGVSRTPIREALKQLATMGLVDNRPHRGTYVKSPSFEEIIEIYLIRASLEGTAARRASKMLSDADLVQLNGLCNRMEDEGRAVGHAQFREFNREFHRLILNVTGFPVLEELVQRFYRQTESARALSIELPGSFEAVCREHRDIVDALRTRDPEASDHAAKRHFLNTATRLAHSLGHDEEF